MNEKLIKQMVDKFLCWNLPKDFSPDGGISYQQNQTVYGNNLPSMPTGTNLFTADQAKKMFECLLADIEE